MRRRRHSPARAAARRHLPRTASAAAARKRKVHPTKVRTLCDGYWNGEKTKSDFMKTNILITALSAVAVGAQLLAQDAAPAANTNATPATAESRPGAVDNGLRLNFRGAPLDMVLN